MSDDISRVNLGFVRVNFTYRNATLNNHAGSRREAATLRTKTERTTGSDFIYYRKPT